MVAEKTHLSRDEVAARWSLSVRTIDDAISDGRLPVVRFGRAVRVPLATVERIDAEGFPAKR